MAFFGFPVAMMVGGLLYNQVGPKLLMYVAFVGHLLGLVLTIIADGFWGLLISTFCIGFANGAVEAGCNPLIADMYHNNKTTMLNRFHVWFPGGIVIGALISAAMTSFSLGWQMQIAVMLLPTLAYGYIVFSQDFPAMVNSETSTSINIRSLASPLFIFMLVCMAFTATTELGTQQWVSVMLAESGAHPMLILAMVTGLMAVGRYFAGPVVHALNPAGVLLASAVVAALGIFMLSQVSGAMVYVAALLFSVGVMYFWPTMIGFVSEYQAKTGALGLSLVGAAGMLFVGAMNPVIGGWIDAAKEQAIVSGLADDAAEVAAGQATLEQLVVFPLVLIVLFSILYVWRKKVRV